MFFGVIRGNLGLQGLFVADDPIALFSGTGFWGHLEWSIIGAIIWGGAVFAITKLPAGPPRVAVGVMAGVLTGYLIGTYGKVWNRPDLEWGNIVIFTVVGAVLGAMLKFRKNASPVSALIGLAIGAAMSSGVLYSFSVARFVIISIICLVLGAVLELRSTPRPAGALMGAAIGWAWAAWFLSTFAGSQSDSRIAAIVPLALLGARLGWGENPDVRQLSRFDGRARAAVFLGPAITFLTAALFIPAIITVIFSFKDRDLEENVGLDNYRSIFTDEASFDVSNWTNIFSSRLFLYALAFIVTGIVIGIASGTKRHGVATFERTGSSISSIVFGGLILAFAVFSVLRGTFFNNLWWVVTVTSLSTGLGLAIAVLAERAGRFQNVAKSLIFMPMAVSFVGASIVWRLQYQPRDPSKEQTGVLNKLWVELGQLSHSSWPRAIVLVILFGLAAFMVYKAVLRYQDGESFGGFAAGFLVFVYLAIQLLDRSLGGFLIDEAGEVVRDADGQIVADTVLFLQEPPFNNVFMMIILIWIQTGFAMVILGAAIRAVPQEYIEAAGSTEQPRARRSSTSRCRRSCRPSAWWSPHSSCWLPRCSTSCVSPPAATSAPTCWPTTCSVSRSASSIGDSDRPSPC